MRHKRQIFWYIFILFSPNSENIGGAELLVCISQSQVVVQNVQDGQCTVCNRSSTRLNFAKRGRSMQSSHLHRPGDALSVAQNFVEIFRPQDVSQSRLCQQPGEIGELGK